MDKYKIRITDQAKQHLMLIRRYIAEELKEPRIAGNLLRLLKTEILSLQTMPYRVKRIDEQPWHDLGFRKILVKNYYIYFWIEEENKEIYIIAVIYMRRDQASQLKQL